MQPNLNFTALDVELADSSYPESICQVGIAIVRNGLIEKPLSKLVNPNISFGHWQRENLAIREEVLAAQLSFSEVASQIRSVIVGPVVCHTFFDRHSIGRASAKHKCTFYEGTWIDSSQIVRRAWPNKYAKSGYGLKNVASDLGIEFRHHDAAEDARVVAEIVLRASSERGLDIQGWSERVQRPILLGAGPASPSKKLRRDGNFDGPLFGEVVVLTGGFEVSKNEQADIAALAGCEIAPSVSKKTTLLVVGNNRFLRGERSGKWKRAEELIAQGSPIRVISESDFNSLISDQ